MGLVKSYQDGDVPATASDTSLLEDWIGFKIDNRTKFDLTISSGLCLLAAQKVKSKKVVSNFSEKQFFRRYKPINSE